MYTMTGLFLYSLRLKKIRNQLRVQWHEMSTIVGRENRDGSSSKLELKKIDFGVRRKKPAHYIF